MGLVNEHRRLNGGQFGNGGVPFAPGRGKVSEFERDAPEQKMGERGLAREQRLIKEFGRTRAELPSFHVVSLMESQQSLIQIKEPRPDEIFFLGEFLPGSRESLERLGSVPLLAA